MHHYFRNSVTLFIRKRRSFAKVFKTLARYRFENNFVWTIKLCETCSSNCSC